jgi:hypothetical protein
VRATDFPGANRVRQTLPRGLIWRAPGLACAMVQMINNGAAINKLSRPPQMIQPRAQVRVLPPQPVYSSSKPLMASRSSRQNPMLQPMIPRWPVLRRITPATGQADRFGPAGDSPGQNPGRAKWACFPPSKIPRRIFPPQNNAGPAPRNFVPPGPRVVGNEAGVRHAIAVQQHDVIALGGGDDIY